MLPDQLSVLVSHGRALDGYLAARLGARRVLDVAERPVGREPLTHFAPERGVQLSVALPYPGENTGGMVTVGQPVDVDPSDHLAAPRVEHRGREPRPAAEVPGRTLHVCS